MTTFEFVRARLVEVGTTGISPSDLFKALRESEVIRRKGTYHSFFRGFFTLIKLGWVEQTGVTEPSFQKGVNMSGFLRQPRVLYRITLQGVSVPDTDWGNPHKVRYPQFYEGGYQSQHYKPTGRKVGRPRKQWGKD